MAARLAMLALLTATLAFSGCAEDGGAGDGGPDGGDGGSTTTSTPTTSTQSASQSAGGASLVARPADPPVGTTWTYQYSGASSGTTQTDLEAHETKSGHETARTVTTTESSGITVEVTGWTRRSDGAQVAADSESNAPYVGKITTQTTYDPPCVPLQYPVRDGAAYTVTCTQTTRTSPGSGSPQTTTTTTQVQVIGSSSTTVPAGTFQTVHVRFTQEDGSVTDSHYLTNGCGIAKSVTGKDGATSTTELKSTTCK